MKRNDFTERYVRSEYRDIFGNVVKNTRARYVNKAVSTAFAHMLMNDYGAIVVDIIDVDTGSVYASFSRLMDGQIVPNVAYDPRGYQHAIRRKWEKMRT